MDARFFNTAGPIKPDIHYNIDPLVRIDIDEIMTLIRQRKYFVLHAPRQTGKTSCLLALRDYINHETQYYAVYANIEAGQALRNNVERVNNAVITTIASRSRLVMGNTLADEIAAQVLASGVEAPFAEFLNQWCTLLDRPLVLMLDEIDALVGDSLVSVLRQIRSGYDSRPDSFPISIILCGVRDVRDYRIHTTNQEIITGGSAFYIKAESLRLGNFSPEEVHELYMQHTAATGQEFAPECFPMIWNATEGQPWLTNALGYEVTMKMREDRVRRVIAPILSGEEDADESLMPSDDLQIRCRYGTDNTGQTPPCLERHLPRNHPARVDLDYPKRTHSAISLVHASRQLHRHGEADARLSAVLPPKCRFVD